MLKKMLVVEREVMVETKTGRQYRATVTTNECVAGTIADEVKAAEAEKEGKVLVYNVKAGQWQKLNIVAIKTDDGFVKVENLGKEVKKERKHPERLSLADACCIINFAYETEVKKEKKGYWVRLGDFIKEFANGFEVVRFAKGLLQ